MASPYDSTKWSLIQKWSIFSSIPRTGEESRQVEEEKRVSMEAKTVSASRLVLAQVMTPQDANIAGNVHGGNIMKLADGASAVVAIRHSGALCVTASVDRFDFHAPVYVGNLVTLHASLNYAGRSSMEVGVRVDAEDLRTGKKTHTNSCYFTMVALGPEGRPTTVPRLVLETDEDQRRNAEAALRVEYRKRRR